MITTNPYNYNLPVGPEMFFGRQRDVQTIVRDLTTTPGDSFALIGGRRMGKTSLLEALLRTLAPLGDDPTCGLSPLPVFLDLTGEGVNSTVAFFRTVGERAQAMLADRPGVSLGNAIVVGEGRPPAPTFGQALEEYGRAALAQRGCRVRFILLLDECEQIVEQPWASEFYGALRYLLVGQATRSLLKVVMTGSHRFLTQVRQRGSPLRNVLKYHRLCALDEQATRDLVTRPTGDALPKELVRAVVAQSGGHPFLTQYLMHHLWEHGLEGATPEAVARIAAGFCHKRGDFWDWADSLGDSGLKVYGVLAEAGGALTESGIRASLRYAPLDLLQALDALCYHGVVARSEDEIGYQVAGQMYRDWFLASWKPDTTEPSEMPHPPSEAPIIVRGDYVAGDKRTGVDQRGQKVQGPQTNIAGGVEGAVAPGQFESTVVINDKEATNFQRGRESSMPDDYFDIQIRVYKLQPDVQSYAVEALLSDGSHFEGGILHLDRQAQAIVVSQYHGLQLFDALFSDPIRRAYERAMIYAEVKTAGKLRVRLWIDNNAAELHSIIWEQLHHKVQGATLPISTAVEMPFSRYLGLETPEPQPVAERPVRMLFMMANPTNLSKYNLPPLSVETEIRNLIAALGDLYSFGGIQCTLMPGRTGLSDSLRLVLQQAGYQIQDDVTSLTNILRQLHRGKAYHILHFLGHGGFSYRKSTTVLYLEDDNGDVQLVKDQVLIDRLAAIRSLPYLIFLSACQSAQRELGDFNPFVGLAPKLVRMGIPAVVAMQDDIPILTARKLMHEFYSCLLEHGLVDKAMNQARIALYDAGCKDWAIPVLFMRLKDGRLFAVESEDEP